MPVKAIEDHLVESLSNSLNVAVCSESRKVILSLSSFVSRFPMFKVQTIQSAKEMDILFTPQSSWSCIVVDAGFPLSDQFFDQITNLNRWVPVIIISDSKPNHLIENWGIDQIGIEKYIYKNLKNRKKGCIVEVCRTGYFKDMVSMILANALKKKIFKCVPDGLVNDAIDELYKMNSVSVDDWVSSIGINNRKLQRHLKLFTDLGPRHILAIYHAYRIAFSTVDNSGNFNCKIFMSHTINEDQRKRFSEYVLSRQTTLL